MNKKNKLGQLTLYVRYCYLEEPYWDAFIHHYYSLGVRNINVIIQYKKDIDSFNKFFYPKDLIINIKKFNEDIRPDDTWEKIDFRKEKKNTKYLLAVDVDEFLYFLNPKLELDNLIEQSNFVKIPWLMNPISNVDSPNSGFYGRSFKTLGKYKKVKKIRTGHRLISKTDFLYPLRFSLSYKRRLCIGDSNYFSHGDGLVLIHNWARSVNDSIIRTVFSRIKSIKTSDSDSALINIKSGKLTIRSRYLAFLDSQQRYIKDLNTSYRNMFSIDKELDLLSRYLKIKHLENYYQTYQEFKEKLEENFHKLPIYPQHNLEIRGQIKYLEENKYFLT